MEIQNDIHILLSLDNNISPQSRVEKYRNPLVAKGESVSLMTKM